jgi:hypothetical protein
MVFATMDTLMAFKKDVVERKAWKGEKNFDLLIAVQPHKGSRLIIDSE